MTATDPIDCVTQASVDARHLALRGTVALRYHPPDSWCDAACNRFDNDNYKHHRCPLGAGHAGECEWSSECGGSRFKKGIVGNKWNQLNVQRGTHTAS